MNALFVHEHKFIFNGDNYYTSGGLPDRVLSRYVDAFGKLTVAARIIIGQECKEGNLITNPAISFKNVLEGRRHVIKKAVWDSDIVIARVPSQSAMLAIYFARQFDKKVCVEVVGDATSYYYKGIKGKLAVPVLFFLQKWSVWTADYVIYVSRFFLQKKYPTKGMALACPDVSFSVPNEKVLKKRLNKIASMDERKITVGLIGSLNVGYRGHGVLIRAAAELKSRGIDVHIRFLGGGDIIRWIDFAQKYDVANQVEFSGVLSSGDDVLNWIDAIDILAMPAKQETLGRSIIEAMSRGCPVLGSIETAIWEQIGSNCLFPSDDYKRLAEMIEEMVYDKEYMGVCAHENFWRSFIYDERKSDEKRMRFFREIKQKVKK